jgi:hypothetical protein
MTTRPSNITLIERASVLEGIVRHLMRRRCREVGVSEPLVISFEDWQREDVEGRALTITFSSNPDTLRVELGDPHSVDRLRHA